MMLDQIESQSDWGGSDRRQYPRYSLPYPIKYRKKGQVIYNTSFSVNISLYGLMFLSKHPFSKDDILDIHMKFKLGVKNKRLTLNAVVLWEINEAEEDDERLNQWMIGLHFYQINEQQKQCLSEFINDYSQYDGFQKKKNKPQDVREYFLRGVMRFEKDLEGAYKDFSKVIEIDPTHAAAYYYRAFIRDRLGDSKGAMADYDEFRKLD